MHDDEIPVDVALVRRLVARALPAYADLDVRALEASGSSNALFRLGPDLLVRLPRQPGGSAIIAKESRWLPVIAAGLSVAVPGVLTVCEPDLGYPERWSVTRWIDGQLPSVITEDGSPEPARHALARDLAAVVTQMREIAVPEEAVRDDALSWYRGGPLPDLDADFREAVEASRRLPCLDLDTDAALRLWDTALAAARDRVPVSGWYHGDLLAENLLVRGDRLVAVLDFGGLAVGDPAVDCIAAWELLDAESRATFRSQVGADDASWLTSMGWALLIAFVTFPYYWETMPARCASRRAMAQAVLGEL
ncbi:aminoglycoside phosphotransferase family protein [Nocardioides mesophilus]|uniref:Aminoglycoside phosphotransferase family protein n=1 Tax=Nocardioides mesophilus TaxID=433659 RepID=A0A7G9R7W9_9ACTN|nr:aminoglycoside phosphotransferase family protein [Nocardioides mesophilus]QNN51694.1 aminoglycoside phosphotransferase family protein [Nocardioides mesophilus]